MSARYSAIQWISRSFHSRQLRSPRRQRRSEIRFPAEVEFLEQRRLLSALFQVTNSADNQGIGSLRYEIDQANTSGDPHAIVEITSSVNGPINLLQGELQILANMSIVNDSGTVVDIHQSTPSSRVFDIGPEALNVSIGSGGGNRILIDGGVVYAGNGGGILVEGTNSKLSLIQVDVANNSAVAILGTGGNGGGIYSSGSVTFNDSVIGTTANPNTASLLGGGVWAQNGVSLVSSHVDGNRAALDLAAAGKGGGGGIFVNDGGVTLDMQSSASHNSALYGEGGGIAVAAGYVDLRSASHVDSNSARDVGGIMVGTIDNSLSHGETAVSATGGSSINSNSSNAGQKQNAQNLGGGGIAVVTAGNVYVDASQVSHNSTVGMYSGGIVVGLGSITVTHGSQINGNSNNGPGGGLAANFGGTVTVSDHSQVNFNIGAALGGGIVNFAGPHGAIIVAGHSQVVNNTLTNAETIDRVLLVFLMTANSQSNSFSEFAASVGGTGGAAMLKEMKNVTAAAGRIQSTFHHAAKQLSISHPLGELVAGGGIASLASPVTISDGSEASHNLVGLNVLGNNHTVIGLGGGIFSLANLQGLTIRASHVDHNQAPHGDGGGIWLGRGHALITDESSVNFNSAGGDGGGIWSHGHLRISRSMVSGNTSGGKGGGIYTDGHLTQVRATISSNSPDNVYHT